jgi:hypothetical protein
MVYGFAIFVQRKYLAAFAEEIHEIAAVSAPGIEHAHFIGNISSENLIEDIDVDLSELFLNVHGHEYVSQS